MSWHISPWIYPVWDSLHFLNLFDYFLSCIREVFNYNLLQYFLSPFLSPFFFWDSINSNVRTFNVVPEVSESVLNSFHSLFCSAVVISTIYLPSQLFVLLPVLFMLLIPSIEFLISFIVLFIIVCLLFSSSMSLLNISCIFSILFPRFWIIFTITLNSFSVQLPISSSFVWSGQFLPRSSICCIFLCFLILVNLLCLGFPIRTLQVRSSCCFWYLPPVVRFVQWVV